LLDRSEDHQRGKSSQEEKAVMRSRVYRQKGKGPPRFVPIPAPSIDALKQLVQQIAERIGSRCSP